MSNGSDFNFIRGSQSGEILTGLEDRDDYIQPYGGRDEVYALGGDDLIWIGATQNDVGEIFDGGDGCDMLILNSDQGDNTFVTGGFDLRDDTIRDIEILSFTNTGANRMQMSLLSSQMLFSEIRNNGGQQTAVLDLSMDTASLDLSGIDFTVNWQNGSEVNVFGTASAETFVTARIGTRIEAGAGNDTLFGGIGDDTLGGGEGNDQFDGGLGTDVMTGGAGVDAVTYVNATQGVVVNLTEGTGTVGAETDVLAEIENITGSIYGDFIVGDAADNRLRGLGDYDWFVGSEGQDYYDGGNGRDMVSYADATGAVTVNLALGMGLAGQAEGDSYVSIERVTGSIYVDTFYGDDGVNDFRGLGGYDTFIGSAGGRERYDGGSGLDTVAYLLSDAGVIASLERGFGSGGDAALDLYTSIENLGGTSYDDFLYGDAGRNNLRGLAGNDVLEGGDGIDRIKGGRGDDTIDGGAGSDFILYDGARADFEIIREGNSRNATVSWTGPGAGDGFDTLRNVEYFVFDDETVNIWSL